MAINFGPRYGTMFSLDFLKMYLNVPQYWTGPQSGFAGPFQAKNPTKAPLGIDKLSDEDMFLYTCTNMAMDIVEENTEHCFLPRVCTIRHQNTNFPLIGPVLKVLRVQYGPRPQKPYLWVKEETENVIKQSAHRTWVHIPPNLVNFKKDITTEVTYVCGYLTCDEKISQEKALEVFLQNIEKERIFYPQNPACILDSLGNEIERQHCSIPGHFTNTILDTLKKLYKGEHIECEKKKNILALEDDDFALQ